MYEILANVFYLFEIFLLSFVHQVSTTSVCPENILLSHGVYRDLQ